ncbi:chromate transporter [Starkeya sp. ORNL1]|uniref:chromate transporter n=1 Tax=Starkeya sp. ORNL1 TaxID=2709380 RepID=UPI0014628785|nr:chromate transporter [Starkeya sp. ORNL1]QJP12611.1 chromate transporter [Starkeya sp. ORNL1]
MNPGIISLISFFGMLSILSIGGSNSVVPEMHRHVVEQYGWLTSAQFADVFAITQATPGPSNLIVALIGYKVAGVLGAISAQIAMMLPAGLLMLAVSKAWLSSSHAPWHTALERALGPIAVGLILASGWTIAGASGLSMTGYVVAACCTILFWKTALNPLAIMALCGLAGWLRVI